MVLVSTLSFEALRVLQYWNGLAAWSRHTRKRLHIMGCRRRWMRAFRALHAWFDFSSKELWRIHWIQICLDIESNRTAMLQCWRCWIAITRYRRDEVDLRWGIMERSSAHRALICWWMCHRLWQEQISDLKWFVRRRKRLCRSAFLAWLRFLRLIRFASRDKYITQSLGFRIQRKYAIHVLSTWRQMTRY